MCGRYTLVAPVEEVRNLFDLEEADERLLVPRYNIAPTQPIAVVREAGERRELVPMRWGLLPTWVKAPADFPLLFNARADGVATKAAFRSAFRRRRCLVPATGFYEWQVRGKAAKQPYLIRPGPAEGGAGRLIAFAGLWETWSDADGGEIDTAAIVTTECNDCLRPIHARMPAVIAPEDFAAWLSRDTEPDAALALLRPAPEDLFACVPVSTRVNAVRYDDEGLLEEVADKGVPEPEQEQLL